MVGGKSPSPIFPGETSMRISLMLLWPSFKLFSFESMMLRESSKLDLCEMLEAFFPGLTPPWKSQEWESAYVAKGDLPVDECRVLLQP